MATPSNVTWHDFARALVQHSKDKSEWAGFPIPVEGMPMHMEPRYPYKKLDSIFAPKPEPDDDGLRLVNQWFSDSLRCDVLLMRDKNGRACHGYQPCGNGLKMLIDTMGAAHVWLMEAEYKAMAKLEELVGEWRARCYFLTGTFIEQSKRSGVCYVFRRLRPTLAFHNDKVLCGLCLHPIGYYQGSWAGCMTPTDDVIAHLCMMRGDEPKFWANANQHNVRHPNCGL